MKAPGTPERIAILWQLAWVDDSVLACSVYRDGHGWELRLESGATLILSERCQLQPRTMVRAHALRESLRRHGWHDPAPS